MLRSIAQWACAVALIVPATVAAQSIQRCEGAGGRVTYSNSECPEGTKAVKAVQSAPTPPPEAQSAARVKAARDAETAKQLAAQRQVQQAAAVQQQQDERVADCAYLRGEIDSIRRLRNAIVNRPYYSLDDLEQMDQHAAQLTTQYQRVCSR
jgi:hypothetical protein